MDEGGRASAGNTPDINGEFLVSLNKVVEHASPNCMAMTYGQEFGVRTVSLISLMKKV